MYQNSLREKIVGHHFHVLPKSPWCPSALLPVQVSGYGQSLHCCFPASICLPLWAFWISGIGDVAFCIRHSIFTYIITFYEYWIWTTHLPVDRHLHYFQHGAFMKNVSVRVSRCKCPCGHTLGSLSHRLLRAKLQACVLRHV